jgi:hypothetical protein
MEARLSPSELRQKPLVEDRLKAIAAQLIAAHRRHDHALVVPYARQAGLTVEGQSAHHLFMKAIQVFHPDRLSVVWDRIDRALRTGDDRTLGEMTRLLEYRSGPEAPRRFQEPEPDHGPEDEVWTFEEEAFEDEWEDEGTFFSAVKHALFGNLEFYPDPADLARLEGELDLSDWDIHDLEGIEHCRSLTSLNLSLNRIDNLYPLKDLIKLEALDLAENDLEDADWLGGLVNLRELDLSANEIDDVAFLDRLPVLRYVDLTGNPVRNKALIARLEARGVIVIL